jgi:hypothetical protein
MKKVKLKEVTPELLAQLEGDEKALADAMLGIVSEYGKFGSESSNVFPNYMSGSENTDSEIGVKCGNCVFHAMTEDGVECSAIEQEIEEDGLCRLAIIPPGLVDRGNSTMSEAKSKLTEAGYTVPKGVQSAAKRALKWIAEGKAGSGFTDTGRRRAAQLAEGGNVSRDTVVRMKSYLARHSGDSKAEGFNSGETGYPSPGRVAWDAWGGDAGKAWTKVTRLDA